MAENEDGIDIGASADGRFARMAIINLLNEERPGPMENEKRIASAHVVQACMTRIPVATEQG